MPKILAYMTLPDNKIDQLKSLIKKHMGIQSGWKNMQKEQELIQ